MAPEPNISNDGTSEHVQTIPYGQPKAWCLSQFEEVKHRQLQQGTFPFGPFENKEDWEFAEWAVKSGLSQTEIDKLVNLEVVSDTVGDGRMKEVKNSHIYLDSEVQAILCVKIQVPRLGGSITGGS
jgi:hypothetical protein